MGYSADDEYSNDFWDKAESFPGGFIIQRELKKAVTGQPFFYNRTEDGKPVRLKGVEWEEFFHYYTIWEDFHYIKILPHGKGTLNERRWVLDIIKIFTKAFTSVENFLEAEAARRARYGK